MELLYFVLLVGVLIFVHELGHFACAKAFDVRVLTFSLGFGPRLVALRIGPTEYVLSALPIGGYVKLLGEGPGDEIAEVDRPYSFGAQSLPRRVAIALAGPAMNLALPLVLFFAVSLGETKLPAPVIGTVVAGEPADGRLDEGDVLAAVDGEPVVGFDDFTEAVRDRPGEQLEVTIDRAGERHDVSLVARPADLTLELDRVRTVGRVGVLRHHPTGVVAVPSEASAAYAAGVRTFDRVVAARGRPIARYSDLAGVFDARSMVPVSLLRPTRLEGALGGLVELDLYEPHVVTVSPPAGRGGGALRVGIESADLYVSHVRVGSAGHRAGVLPGDRIVTFDGQAVRQWIELAIRIDEAEDGSHELVVRRGRDLRELALTLDGTHRSSGRERLDRDIAGIGHWVPLVVDAPVEADRRVRRAASRAWETTAELVSLTSYSVLRLVQGRLSMSSLGGPLSILDETGGAVREGAATYLRLMALVSVNLGVMNLLPIPLLDGGTILLLFIEAIRRRPVEKRTREYASLAGLVVLSILMLVALENDLERKWPEIREAIVGTS